MGRLSDDCLLTLGVPGVRQTAAARSWAPSPWCPVSRGALYVRIEARGKKSFFLVLYPVARQAIPRDGRFRAGWRATPQNRMR